MGSLKTFIVSIILVLVSVLFANGQSVALVLSGGGAKGLYHVGIIKALEENDIPVDYVSGASMGAIVGSLYSMGYSPEEMIRFFESDSVQNWLTGEIPNDFQYYFKKEGTTPDMVSINFKGLKTSTKGESTLKLPTSLISPYLLDIAFTQMMQGASWAAGENFDSLVVPFRCTASDIYNKQTIVFKDGSLPFAVRSSMAIPLIFKPLKKDTTLLYDGGIFNNFPWQCLDKDFKPDIFIGCICAGNETNPKEDDIFGQVMTMITSQTDYNLPDPEKNITIKRRFKDIGTLDYDKADIIIEKGYQDAMAMMPMIKEKIQRKADNEKLKEKRDTFKRKIKPLIFDSVSVDGVNEAQRKFIFRQLSYTEQGKDYDMDFFIKHYFKIISAGVFEGSFPDVTYNPETERYQLHLHMKTKQEFKLSFGGNISSTSLNQAYLGLNYSHVNSMASSYFLGGLLGTFYNAATIGGRHDIHQRFPFYLQYNYTWQQYDYTSNHMSRYNKQSEGLLGNNINNEFHFTLGASAFTNYIFKINWTGAHSAFIFYPGVYVSGDEQDEMEYLHSRLSLQIGKNNLNYRIFSTKGMNLHFDFRYIAGVEKYIKGNSAGSALEGDGFSGQNRSWFEGEIFFENYHHISTHFNLGYLANLKLSNAPDFGTDLSTYFMRKQFSPTPHSETVFMKEYRSESYLGLGIVPIINFTKSQKFFLKTYAYWYVPKEVVYDNKKWHSPTMEDIEQKTNGIFGAALVYQTPIGPASITYDKYTTGNNWCIMMNIGCSIFKINKD